MQQPQRYPRRIILAVSGMSPQIVTETIYSLAVNTPEPFMPTEIHLITTQSGAKEVQLQLLHPKTGKFLQLCADYRLPAIRFEEANIHIIEDRQGKRLDDIKTPQQNEAAADFITNIVRALTRDDNAAVHVSIAGGRKTMGYYVGYALSLYGRPQDRLSHVLVTDRYESHKEFFYPTPQSHVIFDKEDRALDTKEAEVMLAEIPFVRLRSGLPQHLLEGKTGFNESIRRSQMIEGKPTLRIDRKNRCFWAADVKIAMTTLNFAFYLWLLERSIKGKPVERLPADNNQEYAKEFMAVYQRTVSYVKDDDRTQAVLNNGMTNLWISDRINKVEKGFIAALGANTARPFLVQRSGGNNQLRYYIALTEEQLQ